MVRLMGWFQDKFNAWLGSNITYIANAYSNADCIWLTIQSKKLSYDEISASISMVTADARVTIKNEESKLQLIRIPYNEEHKLKYTPDHLTVFCQE